MIFTLASNSKYQIYIFYCWLQKENKDSDDQNDSKIAEEIESKDEPEQPKAPKNNKPCFKCNQPGHFAKV